MSERPSWLDNATLYYSKVPREGRVLGAVFSFPEEGDASDDNPGTRRLYLERGPAGVSVKDADGSDMGTVRVVVPGLKYVMSRSGQVVWTLSVRSLVRKHWRLDVAGGQQWAFDTPFFWWQQVAGWVGEEVKLLGWVGPIKPVWMIALERDANAPEVLAAVALMHRTWSRW